MNKESKSSSSKEKVTVLPTTPSKPSRPKVLMVGWHCCVRVTKQALALKKEGYEIDLLTCRLPSAYNEFGKVNCFYDKDQFVRSLKSIHDEYDLFHIHNEPNTLITEALDIVNKPVVFDAHDYNLLRVPACQEDEIMSVLYSDGIINVSKGIDDYIRKVYALDRWGIPSTVVYSWCSEDFLVKEVGQVRKGIVYEGGLRDSIGEGDFSYRNMEPIVYALTSQGISLNIYCGLSDDSSLRYKAAGATLHGGIPYMQLLQELSRYEWGWTGFNNDPVKKHIQYAVTNKMFEYIAAGTPVLTYMTEEQDEFVKEYEIGLVIKNLKDVRRQIEDADYDKIRKNVLRLRKEFTMEKQTPLITKMYEDAGNYFASHGNKVRIDSDVVDYTSFQAFPVKPRDWWAFK